MISLKVELAPSFIFFLNWFFLQLNKEGGRGNSSRLSQFLLARSLAKWAGWLCTALGFFRQYISFCSRLGHVSSKQGSSHVDKCFLIWFWLFLISFDFFHSSFLLSQCCNRYTGGNDFWLNLSEIFSFLNSRKFFNSNFQNLTTFWKGIFCFTFAWKLF